MTVAVRIPRLTQINHPLIEIPFKQPTLLTFSWNVIRYRSTWPLRTVLGCDYCFCFSSCTTLTSWRTGAWTTSASTTTSCVRCLRSCCVVSTLRTRSTWLRTAGRLFGEQVFLIFNSIRETGAIFSKHLSRHPRFFFFLILNSLQKNGYWGRNRKES